MLRFGVIAEGPTDQAVIKNILQGYFDEAVVRAVQPPPATAATPAPPGGWTRVFQCLEMGEAQNAFQFNDYLVIQIDTDMQEEKGYDVPRREVGVELTIPQRIERVIAKLVSKIDAVYYQEKQDRILFAIAVDSTECWLLPLLYDNNKAEKITGCLDAANAELRRAGQKGLSAGETKFPPAYERASRDYAKRKHLMKHRDRNPSLSIFINALDALQSRIAANKLATPPSTGDKVDATGGQSL